MLAFPVLRLIPTVLVSDTYWEITNGVLKNLTLIVVTEVTEKVIKQLDQTKGDFENLSGKFSTCTTKYSISSTLYNLL